VYGFSTCQLLLRKWADKTYDWYKVIRNNGHVVAVNAKPLNTVSPSID
jgi:hypothetical protein